MGFTTAPICIAGLLFLAVAVVASSEVPEECASPITIEAACWGASDMHHGVDYDHCVQLLSVDPRSKEADDIHGLAVLATSMAIDHAASTESKIEHLADLEPEETRTCFDHCLEQYGGGAADLLRNALDNLRAKTYRRALEQLMATLGASESCEDA